MCVCVCVCVCARVRACKCHVCECYSAVLVIRLAYTSTKTCIKNEWHDYIYPAARGLFTFQALFINIMTERLQNDFGATESLTAECTS